MEEFEIWWLFGIYFFFDLNIYVFIDFIFMFSIIYKRFRYELC